MAGFEQGMEDFGRGLGVAMARYHQEHVAYDQQAQIADALSRVGINAQGNLTAIDPNNPDKTLQPVIDPKALDMFKAANHDQQVRVTGGLEALNRIGMAVLSKRLERDDSGLQTAPGPEGSTFYKWGGHVGNINAPGSKATSNPDLNYTHAVNAHNAQVGQIQDYFTNNYGVGPADILNSQAHSGFVYNEDQKKYIPQEKGQIPDAIGVNTGNGFRWLSKDQFETLKPQAEAWQKLQQNPPKREDYKTPAPSTPTTGGQGDLIAQANQIKAAYQAGKMTRDQAAAAIKSLNVPGLQ